MNETFWGLYEAQISALRTRTSPEEANQIMLETAKLLVEHIDLSDGTISQYDKLGIRKLFAAHNALGSSVLSFYEAEKSRLDPAALNGAIGQKLTSISEQITSTADALKKLQELERDLFAKESELMALEKELEDLKRKAIQLRETERNAESEIQQYKDQFEQLEAIMSGYSDELAFWEAHLGENSAIIEKMKVYGISSITSLLANVEKLKSNIKQDLKSLDSIIKKVIDQEAQVRDTVLRKQNKVV